MPQSKKSRASQGFTAKVRVRKAAEFQLVYSKGIKIVTDFFTFFFKGNALEGTPRKLGITVTKGAGKACERNRLKRQIREIFRLNNGILPGGALIVKANKKSAAADSESLRRDLLKGFRKLSEGKSRA